MNFRKTTGEFRSTDHMHSIRYYVYAPVGVDAKAILQISHGMCEYLERYEEFADFLCKNGVVVCGNDHLGHGELARAAGQLGYFSRKDGWEFLASDLQRLTILMKKQYPELPYFLLGHSMGSFVARRYLEKYGELLNGAVIMGTSGGNPFAGIGIRLADREIKKHGEMYRSPLLNQLSMGGNNKRFRSENDPNSWLSKDTQTRGRYSESPLCSFTFTASGFRDLFSILRAVSAPEWAERVPKKLPILLTSGGMDPIGGYGKGVTKVYEQLKKAGVQRVTLKLYEDDRHEILNETDRDTVYQDILEFITVGAGQGCSAADGK